jgi:aminomethyltransferase
MPIRYASETTEHHSVRRDAGLFDLSHMGEIDVVGRDAGRALDHALVGRASQIAHGRARYSLMCAEDGGIIDDLIVYRLESDRYLVVANAGNVVEVARTLAERTQDYDVLIRNASQDWALIAVQGPASAAIIATLTNVDLPSLKYYAIGSGTLSGIDVLLARTGYTGEDGFEVYCAPNDAPDVWTAIRQAGGNHGLVPAGLACRDTLRLEAGMPLYGHELTRETTPFDVGLGRVVAFDKPDGFVGDAALAARNEEGPQSVLIGLVPAGRRSPRAGYAVLDPATGNQVGSVTSGSPSPTLGHPIAMARIAPSNGSVGTKLHVLVRDKREDAEIVRLPFYARQK